MLLRSLFSLVSAFFLLPSLFAQNIEWEHALGGSDPERAYSVRQTSDGGFIVAGSAQSNDGDVWGSRPNSCDFLPCRDYWVVKLNGSGDTIWTRSLGGSDNESARSVQQTSDGGYIVAGSSASKDYDVSGEHGGSDCWVVKLNGSGDTAWTRSLGGSGDERAVSIQQTGSGGYIMGAYAGSNDGDVSGHHGNFDYWVVKLDSSGDTTWTRALGGSSDDRAASVQQTSDGGYIVAGRSESTDGDVSGHHGNFDYWVVKLDSSGDTAWTRSLGGSNDDLAQSVQQTSDGGYILAGSSRSNDGDVSGSHPNFCDLPPCSDHWIVKLNGSGDTAWTRILGGEDQDYAGSIQQTDDGGYIVAGGSRSDSYDVASGNKGELDYWVLKLNSSGDVIWTRNLGGSKNDRAKSIRQTSDGGYIVAGRSNSQDGDLSGYNGGYDQWVVKLGLQGTPIKERENELSSTVQPNPTNGQLHIDLGRTQEEAQLTIRDLTGRTVKREQVQDARTLRSSIEGDPGLYFVELQTEDGRRVVRKVVKE